MISVSTSRAEIRSFQTHTAQYHSPGTRRSRLGHSPSSHASWTCAQDLVPVVLYTTVRSSCIKSRSLSASHHSFRTSMFGQLAPLMPASLSFAVGASRRPCSVVLPLDFRQAWHLCIRVIPLVVFMRNGPRTTAVAGGGAPPLQQLIQAMAQSKAGKPAGRWQRVEVPFYQEVRRDAQRARQEKVRQEVKLGSLHILSTRRGRIQAQQCGTTVRRCGGAAVRRRKRCLASES